MSATTYKPNVYIAMGNKTISNIYDGGNIDDRLTISSQEYNIVNIHSEYNNNIACYIME